ncbi:hypothetical protein ILYODFUR_008980 [Ilyodon furcidens]|uniref:Uncharacterized protein n=1 Tax=Ilyodon furcidens TaxID=33524 RepID=A0ABV0UQA9_9TELE
MFHTCISSLPCRIVLLIRLFYKSHTSSLCSHLSYMCVHLPSTCSLPGYTMFLLSYSLCFCMSASNFHRFFTSLLIPPVYLFTPVHTLFTTSHSFFNCLHLVAAYCRLSDNLSSIYSPLSAPDCACVMFCFMFTPIHDVYTDSTCWVSSHSNTLVMCSQLDLPVPCFLLNPSVQP